MLDNFYSLPDSGYIQNEIETLEAIVKSFCEICDFPFERIQANPKALEEIVVRVDKRRNYFRYFHNNMVVNQYKIMALYAYWILKLRPFWVMATNEDDEELLEIGTRINEKIALHIFLSIVSEFNELFFTKGQDLVKDYSDELLYSFRYRDISKEAMYLMLDPFYFMFHFERSIDSVGEPIL